MGHAGEFVEAELIARRVSVGPHGHIGREDFGHCRHLDQGNIDRADCVADRHRKEPIVDTLHIRSAVHHVCRQVVDENTRSRGCPGQYHLSHGETGEGPAVLFLFRERSNLSEDFGHLIPVDLEVLVAFLVVGEQFGEIRDHLNGHVA